MMELLWCSGVPPSSTLSQYIVLLPALLVHALKQLPPHHSTPLGLDPEFQRSTYHPSMLQLSLSPDLDNATRLSGIPGIMYSGALHHEHDIMLSQSGDMGSQGRLEQ